MLCLSWRSLMLINFEAWLNIFTTNDVSHMDPSSLVSGPQTE